jgi:hypothetical protein
VADPVAPPVPAHNAEGVAAWLGGLRNQSVASNNVTAPVDAVLDQLQPLLASHHAPINFAGPAGRSIGSWLGWFFPQLGAVARNLDDDINDDGPGFVPAPLRPLLAVMAGKAFSLWSFPVFYYLRRLGGEDFSNITWHKAYDPRSTVTLDNVVDAALANRGSAREILKELMECETRVATDRAENAATGRYLATAISRRMVRLSRYAVDYVNDTHQVRMLQQLNGEDDDEMAGGAVGPSLGDLGTCTKAFPLGKKFTPGMYTGQCACARRCVSSLLMMDSHESPRHLLKPSRNISSFRVPCL